jgi:hypothetical protein
MSHTTILVAIVIAAVLAYWGWSNLKKEADQSAPIVHWKGEKPESVSILDILHNRPTYTSVFNPSIDGSKKWYIGVTVRGMDGNVIFSTNRSTPDLYQHWIENMNKITLPSQFHASFEIMTYYPGSSGIPSSLDGLISQDNSL